MRGEEIAAMLNRARKMAKPFGTSHWCGEWDGCPAMALAWYGGAGLAVYRDGSWWQHRFKTLDALFEASGISSPLSPGTSSTDRQAAQKPRETELEATVYACCGSRTRDGHAAWCMPGRNNPLTLLANRVEAQDRDLRLLRELVDDVPVRIAEINASLEALDVHAELIKELTDRVERLERHVSSSVKPGHSIADERGTM